MVELAGGGSVAVAVCVAVTVAVDGAVAVAVTVAFIAFNGTIRTSQEI